MTNRVFIVAVALAVGCGPTISATTINAPPRPMAARSPASVEIFSSGPPIRPHVDVAYLEAERTATVSFDALSELFAQLRGQAARMGCDGLVIGGVTKWADAKNPNFSRNAVTATCIVYRFGPIAAMPKL